MKKLLLAILSQLPLAEQHFRDTNIHPSLNPPPGWFEKQLRQGKCVILLDLLDEAIAIIEPYELGIQATFWAEQQSA